MSTLHMGPRVHFQNAAFESITKQRQLFLRMTIQ